MGGEVLSRIKTKWLSVEGALNSWCEKIEKQEFSQPILFGYD